MSDFKKIYLGWLILAICFIPSLAQANLSIAPYNADRTNPQNKDWFIFSAKPGETLSDALILNNSDPEDHIVKVLGKDIQITNNGSFTILPDEIENQSAGKWLKLDINQLTVPAKNSIKLPFKIEIPNETQDGEYGAGFGVTLADSSAESLKILVRKGVRTYIAVGDDFKLKTRIEKLNILDLKDTDYDQSRSNKPYFGKDNLILEFEAENLGNVFGVLDCKYALNYADGSVFENSYSTEMAPRVGSRKFTIITNQTYKTGKTQAILDCETKSQNLDPQKVKIEDKKTVISDNLELNQGELDSFEMSKKPAFTQPKSNINDSTISEPNQGETNTTVQNYNIWIYGGIASVLVLIIGLSVYYFYHKKNQKSNSKTP